MATTAKPRKRVAKKTAAKKATPKKKAAAKRTINIKAARKASAKARKRGKKLVKDAQKGLQNVNRENTRKQAIRLALSVVEFQNTTFDNSIDAIGKLQNRSGKLLHRVVKDASWVPGEGKDVVDEWIHAVKKNREDFKKSSDKSFSLVVKYLKRLERESGKAAPKKKAATKKKVAKKKTATKRKVAAKRSPKRKAAPNKA